MTMEFKQKIALLNYQALSSVGFVLLALATPSTSFATTGLGGMEGVAEEVGYFVVLSVAAVNFIWLLTKLFSSDSKKQKYQGLLATTILFTFLSSTWIVDPDLDSMTAIVISLNYIYWFMLFAIMFSGRERFYWRLGFLVLFTLVLLINPKILSFNQYRFHSAPLYESQLFHVENDDSDLINEIFKRKLWKLSDGNLYYVSEHVYVNNDVPLRLLAKDQCTVDVTSSTRPCFELFAMKEERRNMSQPRAIFDFQEADIFPKGVYVKPFALFNIPRKDVVVPKYIDDRIGEIHLIKAEDKLVWNPSSEWLAKLSCPVFHDSALIGGLLEMGADLLYKLGAPSENYTPRSTLYCAFTYHSASLKTLGLIADVFNKTYGEKPFDPSIQEELDEILLTVINRGYLPKIKLERVDILLSLGADINSINKNGDTPLHLVAQSFTKDVASIVNFLLENSASPNTPNNKGQTALDLINLKLEWYRESKEKTGSIERQIKQYDEARELLEKWAVDDIKDK